jgi:colicin import membrane protein
MFLPDPRFNWSRLVTLCHQITVNACQTFDVDTGSTDTSSAHSKESKTMKKIVAALASALLVTTVFAQTAAPTTDTGKAQVKANNEVNEAQTKANKKKHEAQTKADKKKTDAAKDANVAQAKADKEKVEAQSDANKTAADAKVDAAKK